MINAKLKRALAVSLASAMAVSSLAACSSSSSKAADSTTEAKSEAASTTAGESKDDTTTVEDTKEDTTTKSDETDAPDASSEDVTEGGDFTPALAVPSTDGWDESKKIYAYSWNDEFGSRMKYVLEKYPQFADYYEYVNLGVSGTDGTYQTKIDALLDDPSGAYPSLIAMDNDVAKYYLETPNTLAMDEVGITNDMYSKAYPYTIDYATYDGKLKGLTWQAAPGNLAYRASIAEKVLGTSDPDEVQAMVSDWDKWGEVADKMKEAGYYMTSGPDEIKYAVWDSMQTQPWVSDDSALQLDDAVSNYLEMAKQLYDGEYTKNMGMWSEGWTASMSGDNADVFCYFGCTWWLYWCLAYGKDDEGNLLDGNTFGDWRVCEGPAAYHWGGTYVGIMKDTPNPELAAFLAYSLCCDEDILFQIESKDLDFVNNQNVTDKVIADGEVGVPGVLGGQSPIAAWKAAALKIDLKNASFLDAAIKGMIDKASEGYNTGVYDTVEDAVQYIKDQVADQYSYITVE